MCGADAGCLATNYQSLSGRKQDNGKERDARSKALEEQKDKKSFFSNSTAK